MQERFSTPAGIAQAVNAAHDGDFTTLLGEDAETWWIFVRERIDLGANELMLRIDLVDDDLGPWYMWLLFFVQEHGNALALDAILIPEYENDPKAALATPAGREQVPYFVLS